MLPEHTAFVELVDALRSRGAVRVRVGGLEAAFGSERPRTSASDDAGHDELTPDERAYVDEVRARAEEMP